MREWGFAAIAAGLLLMGISFFSSSYDHKTETAALIETIHLQSEALKAGTPLPSDVPRDTYSVERAQRRLFGFIGGGVLFLAGAMFVAFGSRRRRVTSETTAPQQPLPSPEGPPAPEA